MLKVIVVSSIPISDRNSQIQFEKELREKISEINEEKKHEDKILVFFSYSEKRLISLISKNGIRGVIFQSERRIFVWKMTDFIKKVCRSFHKKTQPIFLWVERMDNNTVGNDVIVARNFLLALELAEKNPSLTMTY